MVSNEPAQPVEEPTQESLEEAVAEPGFRVRDASELTPEQLADIEAHAIPAVKRRAPKLSAFFFVGAVVGIVGGLILGLNTSAPGVINRGVYLTVCVAFTTLITSLIAGFIAIQLDNRSIRQADARKKAIG